MAVPVAASVVVAMATAVEVVVVVVVVVQEGQWYGGRHAVRCRDSRGLRRRFLIWTSGEWSEEKVHAHVDLLQGGTISVGGFHFRREVRSRLSQAGRCFDGISGRHFSARTIASPLRM